jgi:hypothetical protein
MRFRKTINKVMFNRFYFRKTVKKREKNNFMVQIFDLKPVEKKTQNKTNY